MASIQNRKWALVQQQSDTFDMNCYFLRDCNDMFFRNQQPTFSFDILPPLLFMILSSIKSYRSVLFAYCTNRLIAIRILLRGDLPMSLIPMDSLIVFL